jgi:hypothetical protein
MLNNLQGLQGLQANKVKMDEFQAQQMNRSKATELLRSYQETQDPAKLNEAFLLDGELANNVLAGIGIQDKARMQRLADDYIALTGSLGNKEQFNQLAAKRFDNILATGGNPTDTATLVKVYNEQGPEAAKAMLQPIGAALVNKGALRADLFGAGGASAQGPTSVKEIEYYQKLLKENPALAEKFAKSRGYVDTPKEQAFTPQERNMETYKRMVAAGDPEAENFGISAGILSREGRQLSAKAEEELRESANQSELNSVNVTRYLDLASRFKDSDISGGILGSGGSWRETAATILGGQDEVSKIVADWAKIRSGEAIASLPQGPATDADIRLALKPLPENANAEYMDKYLRGLAKTAAYKAAFNQAKADFISDNGSLRAKDGTNFGKAWAAQREGVLKSISEDPRFSAAQQPAPAGQGGNVVDWGSLR